MWVASPPLPVPVHIVLHQGRIVAVDGGRGVIQRRQKVFLDIADASNKQEEPQISKPKKEKVEEEKKPVEVKKFNYEDMKPIYSEEELAEIEEQEYEDENAWDDDVDYEEYDEYYDD